MNPALRYAAQGWPVLPIHAAAAPCTCGRAECSDPGKHPCNPRGVRGASTVPRQIEHWLELYPGCSWGIATGRPGPVVLDLDPRNGGDKALRELVEAHGPLPETLTVATGGGGKHFYFKAPAGPAGKSRKVGPGLDYQGAGKYVVAPPSVHASGVRYRWASPRGTPLADVPPWLAELVGRTEVEAHDGPAVDVVRRGDTYARALAYLGALPPSVSGQGGHAALWSAAAALVRGFELDSGDAEGLLLEHFNPRCLPQWSAREIRHKVKQAGAARVPRGYLLGQR